MEEQLEQLTRQRTNNQSLEIKDSRRLSMYVAVYNAPSYVNDVHPQTKQRSTFQETIKPGAFTEALRNGGDILATVDHDLHQVFSRSSEGLLLQEDAKGLYATCWVPETELGNRVLERVRAGDLKGASFTAVFPRDSDVVREDGSVEVTKAIKLLDVCVTANAAYPQTDVKLRTADKHKSFERRLRILKLKAK